MRHPPFSHLGELPPVSIAETLTSKPGIVDLWYDFYEDTADPALLAKHHALMTPDEVDRHRRFHFERDRRMFVATRAIVRTVLSAYAGVAPADWRFTADAHGKPRISHPSTASPIHFNLSNTKGLVVCAVSVAHELTGVDAEFTGREVEYIQLAERFFSPSEAAAIRVAPSSEQARRFYTTWTLKESYIKACGLGLGIPLDRFSLSACEDAVSIAFDPPLHDDPAHWQFASMDASPQHRVAVAANTGGIPLSLRGLPVRYV